MKKIIIIAITLLFFLTGCNSSNSEGNQNDDVSNNTEQDNSFNKENITIKTINFNKENMRPIVLETSNIKVCFNRFSYANSKTVYCIEYIVENNTNVDIEVVLTDVVVNGYDVSTSLGKTVVKPGHKANCDSSVWQKKIDETGESQWNVIEGVIEISKDDDGEVLYSIPVVFDKECWEYEEDYAKNNPIKPVVSTDLNKIPNNTIVISSKNLKPALVDEKDVKASVSSFGYANGKTVFKINFSLDNKSEEKLRIVLTDVVIDGYDVPTTTGMIVVEPGHKAICDSSVWQKEMNKVGIDEWIVLKGTVEIRKGFWGDTLYSIPVVIYRDAWASVK